PPWQAADRELEAGCKIGDLARFRPADFGDLAAAQQEDAVRALDVAAVAGAPRPLLVARQAADIFGPVVDNLIRAKSILPAFLSGDGGETGPRLLLPLDLGDPGSQQKAHSENNRDRDDDCKMPAHPYLLVTETISSMECSGKPIRNLFEIGSAPAAIQRLSGRASCAVPDMPALLPAKRDSPIATGPLPGLWHETR